MKKVSLLSTLFFLLPFIFPVAVSAHAFGNLYNLPVPFWLYLYGGAAALIVSFLIIGYFFNTKQKTVTYPTIPLPGLGFFMNTRFTAVLKIVSLLLLLVTIISGLWGVNIPTSNFNMTFFWIIFILGFTYLVSLIGNVWEKINPWQTIVESFYNKKSISLIPYPSNLGYYPALIIYFLFIWLELIGRTTPLSLSLLLILYTFINFIGVFLIGKDNWFRYGEFFSVFFTIVSKISFIEYKKGKLYLRPPFVGLVTDHARHFSLLLFILFMLSSTAFDGFRETTPWYRLYWEHLNGWLPYPFFQTIGLLLSPILFLALYLILIALAKLFTKSKSSVNDLALRFAFPLIPIALVYNIAHYYTLLLTQGQEIIRLVSDPFGFHWNLFGTAGYRSNIGIVSAGFVWHSQVTVILLGHIAAVYLAHVLALQIFPSRAKALVSQIPMLILMVAYTMIGLWILSQPITSGI